MTKGNPYSALGGIYEYLNDDCGYEEWSQYLIEKLKSLQAGFTGLDIGCGDGYFTRALVRAGYDMKGMDISPEMLSAAQSNALSEGLRAEYLLGDVQKLNLNFKPDFMVAVNDCFNYVSPQKLLSAFSKVYKNLKKGGVFIFDISTEYKLKNILGNNVFAYDKGDAAYMWFNTLKDYGVEMDITVFTRRADGRYERKDEQQTQYIHKKDDIVNALTGAGFSVTTEGHLGKDEKERINFICVKI